MGFTVRPKGEETSAAPNKFEGPPAVYITLDS